MLKFGLFCFAETFRCSLFAVKLNIHRFQIGHWQKNYVSKGIIELAATHSCDPFLKILQKRENILVINKRVVPSGKASMAAH